MRILVMLLPLVATACHKAGSTESVAPGDPAAATVPGAVPEQESVQLESLYLSSSIRFIKEAIPARFVSLRITERSSTSMKGTLLLDPNTCSLDAFGDRRACTRIGVRGIEVELRRMQLIDRSRPGRRYFEVIGDGLPDDLALIVRGDFQRGELERAYLKLGTELVPLFLDDDGR